MEVEHVRAPVVPASMIQTEEEPCLIFRTALTRRDVTSVIGHIAGLAQQTRSGFPALRLQRDRATPRLTSACDPVRARVDDGAGTSAALSLLDAAGLFR
jgi:hypothetical protein